MLDRTEFAYDPANKADRRRAYKEAQRHADQVTADRDQAAGRQLTERELIEGVPHPETRSLRERIGANVVSNKTPPDESVAIQDRINALKANPGATRAERAASKRRVAALETLQEVKTAEKEAADQRAAVAATLQSEKGAAALQHARSIVEEVRFNSTTPQAEVEAAEARLSALLETGDFRGYWRDTKAYIESRDRAALAAAELARTAAQTLADQAAALAAKGIPPDALEPAGDLPATTSTSS